MPALARFHGVLLLVLVLQPACGTRPNPAWDSGEGDAAPDADDGRCGALDACPPVARHCVDDTCYAGTLGDPCNVDEDCSVMAGFCVERTCSDGTEGDPCVGADDCNGDIAPFCVGGACRDGSLGDPCEQNEQCRFNHCGEEGACEWK